MSTIEPKTKKGGSCYITYLDKINNNWAIERVKYTIENVQIAGVVEKKKELMNIEKKILICFWYWQKPNFSNSLNQNNV